jgi:hypothetical protein
MTISEKLEYLQSPVRKRVNRRSGVGFERRKTLLLRLFGFLLLALVAFGIRALGLLLFYPWPSFR